MQTPNILLLVWDSCRQEAAESYAPNLESLATKNLSFENAITPAGFSLPAHASLMTGTYPHKHGILQRGQDLPASPLLQRLGEQGYTRYGVSANGFASPRYGFDGPFDEFYNTQGQIVYPDGLDLHRYVRESMNNEPDLENLSYLNLFRRILAHHSPIKSFVNAAAVALTQITQTHEFLRNIPHPRFSRFHEFTYSPDRNTDCIESVLQNEMDSEEPFFLFANYMDPHHPYSPPKRYQRKYCNRTFSYSELARLARETHPWEFMQQVSEGAPPPETTLDKVRQLYAGEVRTADEHLGKLLTALDRHNLRDETLIIVTADHGENLGETDRMGEQRIGHECSASDYLLRVPLVIAHPRLKARSISDYVSIKDLFALLTDGLPSLIQNKGQDIDPLLPPDGIVASQVPPPANRSLSDRYPSLRDVLERYISVVYLDGWKIVRTSTGERRAWFGKESKPIEEAPKLALDASERHLEQLVAEGANEETLNQAEIDHLRSLGYL